MSGNSEENGYLISGLAGYKISAVSVKQCLFLIITNRVLGFQVVGDFLPNMYYESDFLDGQIIGRIFGLF